jgi:SnoaL-like protein
MSTEMPEPVSRYFEHDARRDIDAIVALFADDATVTDEAETRHGIAEIRTWQLGPASTYTYRTELRDTDQLGSDRYLVTGRLTGNFPGGTAELTWDFTIAGNEISRLVIAPPRRQSR